jgi:glycerophosphoryl diester phosphodiesterase
MRRRTWIQLAAGGAAQATALGRVIAAGGATRPLVAAHRGGALLWPENSMTAYRNALGLKVDFLETDVHLTADGQLAVIHDPTLDRTTTTKGPVSALSQAELSRVRLKGLDGAPTADGVPTLAELLDLLAGSRAGLLLEIKVDADRRRYRGIEEKVLEQVVTRGLLERAPIMGFQQDTIRRVRELEPRAETVLLVDKAFVDRQRAAAGDIVRWTTESGARTLGIQHTAIDARLVSVARAAGIRIAAWTVNDEPDIRRAIDVGVDIVISDRPDQALKLVGR